MSDKKIGTKAPYAAPVLRLLPTDGTMGKGVNDPAGERTHALASEPGNNCVFDGYVSKTTGFFDDNNCPAVLRYDES